MRDKTFVGFGFGAIQVGLFLYEAHNSGNFSRLVAAEVVPELVTALRCSKGRYRINVATRACIEAREVRDVEIFNPLELADREKLVNAVAGASEIATALPSVDFFDRGKDSAAEIIACGLKKKAENSSLPQCVVYAGENHNHAAEILQRLCHGKFDAASRAAVAKKAQFLNTVIGKMSGVITDAEQIKADRLVCVAEGIERAFLVEEFNRILITAIALPGFKRGIEVFEEKTDLLPFEEAKLYGHNAVHALLGYLADQKGYAFMSDVGRDAELLKLGHDAFIEESGRALISKHSGVDRLFTADGYREYAEDLLDRMMNPFLRDRVARVIRDPRRKLAWHDRLVGTMNVALDEHIVPRRFALGAAAALNIVRKESPQKSVAQLLIELWPEANTVPERKKELTDLILDAAGNLDKTRAKSID